jgi:hypothetical protein
MTPKLVHRRHGEQRGRADPRVPREGRPFGTLYYPCHDWVDPKLAKRSMQLMAEQVMPKVNSALKE